MLRQRSPRTTDLFIRVYLGVASAIDLPRVYYRGRVNELLTNGMAARKAASDQKLEGHNPLSQPEVNIGTLGHVDNGKSTIVQALTGVWTGRHSEELRRGITIRIGYADASFFKCMSCGRYGVSRSCEYCGERAVFQRAVSFVDCPGHHSLMVTMLSGAALMDGALFVIAADTACPQAQDREHLLAAEMVGVRNIIIVQNKIDLADRERALENYREIKEFVKGTVAEASPIIPISAQHRVSIDILIQMIQEHIPTPKRDPNLHPRMHVLRSFDVNKPGTEVQELVGGVLGGSITQGVFRVGDEIQIVPGIRRSESKSQYQTLLSQISSLQAGGSSVKEARPGGLVGIGSTVDSSLTKADSMVGNVVGRLGLVPEPLAKLTLKVRLFEKAVGTSQLVPVDKIRANEALVLNAGTAVTSGTVTSARDEIVELLLRKPVFVEGMKVALSRRIGESWRLIGYASVT